MVSSRSAHKLTAKQKHPIQWMDMNSTSRNLKLFTTLAFTCRAQRYTSVQLEGFMSADTAESVLATCNEQ